MTKVTGKRWAWLMAVLLIALPLLLAACGGDDDKGGLSQTFSEGGYTVHYPDGWAARYETDGQTGGVMVVNRPEIFDEDQDALSAGGFGLTLAAMSAIPAAGLSSVDLMQDYVDNVTAGGDAQAEAIKVAGHDGYRLTSTSTEGSGVDMVAIVFTPSDDYAILAAGVCAEGQIGSFENTMLDILGTVKYEAP